MGYSSIANAGYLLLGIVAMSKSGASGVLFYVSGYLFTVLAAFTVVSVILARTESDDLSSLHGLSQRSPVLAGALAVSMASLAGVPPMAGFVGKFLLLKPLVPLAASDPFLACVLAVALVGVVVSLYYYFGMVRAAYWGNGTADLTPIRTTWAVRAALCISVGGILWLGILPDALIQASTPAVEVLKPQAPAVQQQAVRP
jgi:NADH-quinone oxidoreductase subunit N